jgi:pyruvate/2-oxoglutarate dehydrogenase complex dihydrolipoamide acyltransferase (E2) component
MAAAGLDKSLFAGKDFVSGADVLAVLQPPATVTARSVTPARSAPVLPADPQKVIVEKLSKAKRREIEYLSDIQSTGLTSTVHSFVDTEGIFTHINRSHKYLKDSLLPVIIYEASRLLASYPLLNGYYTEEGVALYKEINIGFAIDIDKGLKVLKIPRSADMSITGLEATIIELSGRYLDDTLQIDDLSDITFTITDLSAEGVTFFQPLINKMNSAILGMSAIDTKLQRATLSLTFDHRVTEGKTAARFLNDLKDRLESYRQQSPLYQDISCFKCFKSLKEDLGGSGFARCITPEGKEGYICQTCFKGF